MRNTSLGKDKESDSGVLGNSISKLGSRRQQNADR